MSFSAVIVAAGSGSRAGPGAPKTWRSLGGRPVLRWSAEAFVAAGGRRVAVVVAPQMIAEAEQALAGLAPCFAVAGGDTRVAPLRAGPDPLAIGRAPF